MVNTLFLLLSFLTVESVKEKNFIKERNFISNCAFGPILLYVLCQCIYVLKFEIKYF